MMANYFQIIEESNSQLIKLINKQKVNKMQYFPVFAFSSICGDIVEMKKLQKQQKEKVQNIINKAAGVCKGIHVTPESVLEDGTISQTYKAIEMVCSIINGSMNLDSVEEYLRGFENKRSTDYRKVLCAYDMKKYSDINA